MSIKKAKRKDLLVPLVLLIMIAMLSIGIVLVYSDLLKLHSDFDSYVESHHYTDSQYQTLRGPKLIANVDYLVDEPAMDIWIGGVVFNAGYEPAYNCAIGIYGENGTASFNIHKSVALGTIAPNNSESVNTHVNYSDSAVSGVQYHWNIKPEWTSTP